MYCNISKLIIIILIINIKYISTQTCDAIITPSSFDGSFELGDLTSGNWDYTDLAHPYLNGTITQANATLGNSLGCFLTEPTDGNNVFVLGFDGGPGPANAILTTIVDIDIFTPVSYIMLGIDYRVCYDLDTPLKLLLP